MLKVYKTSDRIPVKIGDVVVKVSPLTYQQKIDISNCTKTVGGQEIFDATRSAFLAIKFCVKEVSGVVYADGSKFELEFEDGVLKDDTVDEIMNMEINANLIMVAMNLLNGVPEKPVNPETGKPLKGVEFLNVEVKTKVKK